MGDDPKQLLCTLHKEIASFLGGWNPTLSSIMNNKDRHLSLVKRKRRIFVVKLAELFYRLPKLYSLSVMHCRLMYTIYHISTVKEYGKFIA